MKSTTLAFSRLIIGGYWRKFTEWGEINYARYKGNIAIDGALRNSLFSAIEYDFNISAHRVGKVPQNISVHLINHSNAALNFSNLVLDFYVDDEGFCGTWEKVRFLKKDLRLAPKQTFNISIPFDSLTIVGFKGESAFPNKELQNKMQRGKKIKIKASMSDWRRLENPLESSSLIWSNMIEF